MRTHAAALAALLLLAGPAAGQSLLDRAERLAQRQPEHRVGVAEIKRAAGQTQTALADLRRAEPHPVRDLICWRLLAAGPGQSADLRAAVADLRKAPVRPNWLPVYELHLAAVANDRSALVRLASNTPPFPDVFPPITGERAHLAALAELGWPKAKAGLEVIAHRSHQPLHALRDLDRALDREAEFLRSAGQAEDGAKLLACRDRLRNAYLAASRHLVERLFALRLLGRTDERDALLEKARALPYLHDRQALAGVLTRLDDKQAWEMLVQPLLDGEVGLIEAPPALDNVPAPPPTEMHISARERVEQGGATVYRGQVEVRLGKLALSCDRLATVRAEGGQEAVLAGTGAVLHGLPGLNEVFAERFTFTPETGIWALAGNVRLRGLKLRSCTLDRAGSVRDARSLLDDFGNADHIGRLALLPAIERLYTDRELPSGVRYLLALDLLRPNLTWHAPTLPSRRKDRAMRKQADEHHSTSPWQAAHEGEDWLQKDVPAADRQALRKALDGLDRKAKDQPGFAWRLHNPQHPDIARAIGLLRGVEGELAGRAWRWIAELRRNNTVLTLDVVGGYAVGKNATVALDARNADRVTFRLYRVRQPEDLVWVSGKIGSDFVYFDQGPERKEHAIRELELARSVDEEKKAVRNEPAFLGERPIHTWSKDVADLPSEPSGRDPDRNDDDESDYFDDECRYFRARLDKAYRPDAGTASSWCCDRMVEVPGKALSEAGAYVLAVEANGQVAYAPLLVEPLSLALRRCRDGAFVLVSDHEGKLPISGARLHADRLLGEAVTDEGGAAFARVFARGDRALIVHKDGKFAIGGFGRVFDGAYQREHSWSFRSGERKRVDRRQDEREALAQVYADRHVIAALTDQPTYRPGQDVQLKLIIRRLSPAPNQPAPVEKQTFRAADFDTPTRFEAPPKGASVRYALIDARGRTLARNEGALNDLGTLAGTFHLGKEVALGSYALRVEVGGQSRIVPDAFAVQEYRRPTFALEVKGVPLRVTTKLSLTIELEGRYYFGKPVVGGAARVRLLAPDVDEPLSSAAGKLDADGRLALKLALPADLDGGHDVVCELRDDSGRSVTRSLPLTVRRPGSGPPRLGLSVLPRFLTLSKDLEVRTSAAEVVAEQGHRDDKGEPAVRRTAFPVRDGVAKFRLRRSGWWTLTAGKEATDIFVYGSGKEGPFATWGKQMPRRSPWVSLNDDRAEAGEGPSRGAGPPVLALFDRRQANVGEQLPVLVYCPHKKARLVFTLEGRSVVDYFTTWTEGPYQVVFVPITARCRPNFYLRARAVVGEGAIEMSERPLFGEDRGQREDDLPRCRVEVIDPKAPPGEERLMVRIEAEERERRPGDEVSVRLRVTDRAGKPRPAEVCFSAVDESVFSFGEDRLDGLARLFSGARPPQQYARKPWRSMVGANWTSTAAEKHSQELVKELSQKQSKQLAELRKSAVEPALGERERPARPRLEGELPATNLPLGRLRFDFRETAAWQPQLRAGADGIVNTTFRLPDSLTAYRLTAVALDGTADIGVGRSAVRATLPLAVQCFVPRFAVEKDRLQAVGLIHNNTKKARNVAIVWEVNGARVEGPTPSPDAWRLDVEHGLAKGKVTVAAGASLRLGLWLTFERAVPVTVALRAVAETDSDYETRTFPVQPLGRPGQVTRSGRFTGTGREQLPRAFVARDLQLVLALDEVAGALDGLGQLVEYPHGCVEQTMSRFYPAVVVKAAAGRAGLKLPPDVAERLPKVLAQGLARLANFQHADGGWGWWKHDPTNLGMTAYVVHGLARCRQAGAAVDEDVLRRGCVSLTEQLRSGKHSPSLIVDAHLALALAGRAERDQLAALAKTARGLPPEARCRLALACRWAGQAELAERLWKMLDDWRPDKTEALAARLSAAVCFGAPLSECQEVGARLLARRSGPQWENTLASAHALDALSALLAYLPPRPPAKSVKVVVAGKTVLLVRDPVALAQKVFRMRLPADKLPGTAGAVVELEVEHDGQVSYSMLAMGTQRLDRIEPSGTEMKLTRRLEGADGEELDRPVRVGEVVAVRLTVELARPQERVLIEDRRPAGAEFAAERLLGPSAAHVEFRDDRMCAFFTDLPAGRHELVYYLRAEVPGTSHILPGQACPMYADTVRGETGADILEVRAP